MAVIGPAQVVRIAIWVFASGVQIRVIGSLVVLAFPLVFLGLMVTPPVFPAVALIVATYGAANGIMTIVRGLGLLRFWSLIVTARRAFHRALHKSAARGVPYAQEPGVGVAKLAKGLELAESQRSEPVWTLTGGRAVWTSDAVKAGLIRFTATFTGLPRKIVPRGFEDYAHLLPDPPS
jgi:hypothetical protein